ncbi:MAG: GNAT family N-acetyltransferase [Bacteroidota bacterium]
MLEQLDYAATADFLPEKIIQLISREDARLLVAEASGRAIGVISIHFIPQLALKGDFARISYFVVEANHRSQGIGSAIEQELERLARERGCDRIEVHCHTRRTDAHRFYLAAGYEESPRYFIRKLRG